MQLQHRCEDIGRAFAEPNLPLKMYGKNCEVKFRVSGDEANSWVEVRTSIDNSEQLAIIVQMLDDGDRVVNAFAKQVRTATIEKACKYLEGKAIHGWIEDEEVDKFVEQFRKAMQ